MKNPKEKKQGSPYDLTNELKSSRERHKPIYNKNNVSPYNLDRETERRLSLKSNKNGSNNKQ